MAEKSQFVEQETGENKPRPQSKYVTKLIENAIILEEEDAKEAGRLGYMARTLVQATLPHSDPKTNEFVRVNGHYTLEMIAPSSVGLPYGSIPRIILAWITTEAVRTKNKHIYLGENLSSFLHKLGFENTGGKRGDITRVKEQLKRLLKTHISISYIYKNVEQIKNIQAISQSQSLWLTNNQDATVIWQTELILNQEFFEEIINHPVPIDLGVIQEIKNSSLAIDIYCWVTYRCFSLKRDTLIPWDKLFLQFGTGYSDDKSGRYAFKKRFIEQLNKVCLMYSRLNVDAQPSGLFLKRSLPHITPKSKELPPIQQQKSIILSDKEMKAKENAQIRYKTYVINKIIEIIQTTLEDGEKTRFLSEFNDYISRNKFNVSANDLHNRQTKEHLYDFINSRWHHLLSDVKSFHEFTIEEKIQEI